MNHFRSRASGFPEMAAARGIVGLSATAICMCGSVGASKMRMMYTTSPPLMNRADRTAFGRLEDKA